MGAASPDAASIEEEIEMSETDQVDEVTRRLESLRRSASEAWTVVRSYVAPRSPA